MGEFTHRSTPSDEGPGDKMNSLLHIVHAQTIDQQRRRRRAR
jgi:hypothetical protein